MDLTKFNFVPAVSSRIIDDGNKHILIWDFDNKNPQAVFGSLINIQKDYELSNIYIVKTKNGFNAVCLDILPADRVYEIKNNTKGDDYAHAYYGYKYNSWCFRLGDDKKITDVLINNTANVQSLAHKVFFETFFNRKFTGGLYNTCYEILIEIYPSKHNSPEGLKYGKR